MSAVEEVKSRVSVSDSGVHVGSRVIAHTTGPWTVKRNRHTSTDGNDWGWIEGAAHDATWSNDCGSKLTAREAYEAAGMHNQWLENQRPVSLRLIDANDRLTKAARVLKDANERLEAAEREHVAASDLVAALEASR